MRHSMNQAGYHQLYRPRHSAAKWYGVCLQPNEQAHQVRRYARLPFQAGLGSDQIGQICGLQAYPFQQSHTRSPQAQLAAVCIYKCIS